jgi:hypothetical protein
VTAVVEGVAARPGWYGRAVGARILPLLGPTEVDRVAAVLGAFDAVRLYVRETGTPEEELAAAHGNVSLLTVLTARVDSDLAAELCRAAVLAVRDGVYADADDLTDDFERLLGTDPTEGDSDGDGFSDGYEQKLGVGPADRRHRLRRARRRRRDRPRTRPAPAGQRQRWPDRRVR